jgi:predicted  nucleic acid-binding Zn-ribbon protein
MFERLGRTAAAIGTGNDPADVLSFSRDDGLGSGAVFNRAPRRVVAALAVSAGFGVLGFGAPAYAQTATTSTGGICNGVTNQLAHRGMVQPNLLKAAARQNAAQIATLQAERAALVTRQTSLAAQVAAAEKQIADLDAANAKLDGEIAAAEMLLTKMTEDRATLDAAIKAAEVELTTLQGQRTTLVNQITPLQTQLADAQKTLAGLNTQKAGVESSLDTKRVSSPLRTPGWTARPPRRPPRRTPSTLSCSRSRRRRRSWPDSSLRATRPRCSWTPPRRSWPTPAPRCQGSRLPPRPPTPTPPPRPPRWSRPRRTCAWPSRASPP